MKQALTVVALLVAPGFPAAAEPVIWRHLSNATVSGSSLAKSGPTGLWDGGASSTKAIGSGSGSVRFTVPSADGWRVIGLSKGDSGQGPADVDFGIYLSGEDALLHVIESGVLRGPFGSYTAGDVFRVEVAGAQVLYIRNGIAFYTSTVTPTYPLLVDVSLYTSGLSVSNVELQGALVDSPAMDLTTAAARIFWRSGTGQLTAWLLNGTARSGESPVTFGVSSSASFSGVGDFSGDEKGDLVSHTAGGVVAATHVDGVTNLGNVYATSRPEPWRTKGVGDFNGDGKPDIVWRSTATGENLVWFMSGVAVQGTSALPPMAATDWDIVGTGDFDGDEKVDLLWRHSVSGQNVIWRMNGVALAGEVWLESVAEADWKVFATGDVDEDGSIDILWWNAATGDVRVWAMDGTSYESTVSLPRMADTSWQPIAFVPAQRAAAPRLNPAPGAYAVETITVTVLCPTSGSTVRYTTNGAEPTETDAVVACGASISTSGTTTLKLKAWKETLKPSLTRTAVYNAAKLPVPTVAPNGGAFTNDQSVQLSSNVAGAVLHYTLDGVEPTEANASVASGGTVVVAANATLKVKAFKSGLTPSDTSSTSFSFSVAAPTVAPPAGAFAVREDVTLSSETSHTMIRYTTDGSEPGESSSLYAGPISVTAATTIKARAFRTGWPSSPVATATYTPAGPTSEAVTAWRNKVNVAFEGPNTFYKSGGGDGAWDAGASSVKAIAGGYGYVQFTAAGPLSEDEEGNRTFANVAVGLSNGDSHRSYTDIDFGIVLGSNETVNVVVNGAGVWGGWGAWYGAGDRFVVEVTPSGVNFYQNEGLLYTTSVTPVYPLLVDTSIASTWGYVRNVTLYGVLTTGSKPVAALGGPYSSRPRELIRFDGSGSYATDGALVSYNWAFGDGWTATGAVANHAYDAAGTYPVTLTVRDSNGRSATGSTTAAISDGPAAEGVVWRNIVNLTAGGGGHLVKSGDYDWNAGASSRKALARGPGWFEFTLQGPSELSIAAGLSNGDTSLGPADIDFGFQIQGDAVTVVESGVALWGGWGQWHTNPSRYRVEVVEESRQPRVRYYWNGSLVYESTRTPVYPLSAKVSMASDGSAIVDPVLYGVPTVTYEPIPAAGGPYWSRVGDTLTFDGRGSYDSDGGSIASYAWDFGDGGTASGVRPTHTYTTLGTFVVTLTVTDDSGHSATASTTAAIVDETSALSTTVSVHWVRPINVTISPGGLLKTSSATAWDAGAVSSQVITADSYVEFTAGNTVTDRLIGLGTDNNDAGDADVEYGLRLGSDGEARVFESGALRTSAGTYVASDVFRISVDSDVVTYKKNGIPFYTSEATPRHPLHVDASIRTPGGSLTNVRLGGGVALTAAPMGTAFVSTQGPGNARDWIGLYSVKRDDTELIARWYLNGSPEPPVQGLSSARLALPLPTQPGIYQFRFFLNGTYERAARGMAIVVNPVDRPTTLDGAVDPDEIPDALAYQRLFETLDWLAGLAADAPVRHFRGSGLDDSQVETVLAALARFRQGTAVNTLMTELQAELGTHGWSALQAFCRNRVKPTVKIIPGVNS